MIKDVTIGIKHSHLSYNEIFDGTKMLCVCNLPMDAGGQIVSQHNSFVDAGKY